MFGSLIYHIGFWHIARRPSLWYNTFRTIGATDTTHANKVYEKIVDVHRSVYRSKITTQKEKILDFLCALHLQEEQELLNDRYKELSWCYEIRNGKVWMSLAWMDAIQRELQLSLIPEALFRISTKTQGVKEIAEVIHYMHLATYNIMAYKGLIPSLKLVFRNAVHLDKDLKLVGKLPHMPVIEYDTVKLGGSLNYRACSLKPHGCENYDLDRRMHLKFVIARGMDEKEYSNFECVMPTILYTLHEKMLARFKSAANLEDVIVISGESLRNFLYLYENHIV